MEVGRVIALVRLNFLERSRRMQRSTLDTSKSLKDVKSLTRVLLLGKAMSLLDPVQLWHFEAQPPSRKKTSCDLTCQEGLHRAILKSMELMTC